MLALPPAVCAPCVSIQGSILQHRGEFRPSALALRRSTINTLCHLLALTCVPRSSGLAVIAAGGSNLQHEEQQKEEATGLVRQ